MSSQLGHLLMIYVFFTSSDKGSNWELSWNEFCAVALRRAWTMLYFQGISEKPTGEKISPPSCSPQQTKYSYQKTLWLMFVIPMVTTNCKSSKLRRCTIFCHVMILKFIAIAVLLCTQHYFWKGVVERCLI